MGPNLDVFWPAGFEVSHSDPSGGLESIRLAACVPVLCPAGRRCQLAAFRLQPVKPELQVLWHRSCPRAVVEQHHKYRQGNHRGNGPYPIKMSSHQTALRVVRRHSNYLLGAEIGG